MRWYVVVRYGSREIASALAVVYSDHLTAHRLECGLTWTLRSASSWNDPADAVAVALHLTTTTELLRSSRRYLVVEEEDVAEAIGGLIDDGSVHFSANSGRPR